MRLPLMLDGGGVTVAVGSLEETAVLPTDVIDNPDLERAARAKTDAANVDALACPLGTAARTMSPAWKP